MQKKKFLFMMSALIPLTILVSSCSSSSNDAGTPVNATQESVVQVDNVKYSEPFVFSVDIQSDNIDFPIKINTEGPGNVSYDVDCDNDNVYEITGQTSDSVCRYSTKGIKTIKIKGELPSILLADTEGYQVLDIAQWGKITWKTMENFSSHCTKLTISAADVPDLSLVKSLKSMFHGAKSLNSSINHWDVSTIEDMSEMFQDAASFDQPLNNWKTSHVTAMDSMFEGAESFNQDISSWNVSNVKSMTRMFKDAESFNKPLNSWRVGNVQSMDMMFSGASSFNQPLDQWNVDNVVNIEYMFFYATSFSQSLSSWKLKKVKSVYGMFSGNAEMLKNNQDVIKTWEKEYHIDISNIFEKE